MTGQLTTTPDGDSEVLAHAVGAGDAPCPFAGTTREDLDRILAGMVHLPRQKSASLRIVEVSGVRAVLKDFRPRSFLWRAVLGPLVVRREVAALRSLSGRAPVPRLLALVDKWAYIMDYVEGEPCSLLDPATVTPEFFEEVRRAINLLHEAGWVHGDLKSLGNLVRTPDNRVVMLDFATAFRREGSFGPLRRWAFRRAAEIDLMAVAKLKRSLMPEALDEAERWALAHPPLAVRLARAYRRVYERVRRPRRPSEEGGA